MTDSIADLAEIAASKATLDEFRRESFRVLDALVGFDYGIVWRTDRVAAGSGMTVGFPAAFFEHYKAHEARFAPDLAPVIGVAAARSVSLDTEVLSVSQRSRLAFYSEIIRPIGSRSFLTGVLKVAGETLGVIQLGRATPTFDERSVERLSRALPILALGEHVRKATPSLTAREREITDYVALGFTNAEIARACGTSAHTVRNQLHKLYAKLGASTRAELVGLLRR